MKYYMHKKDAKEVLSGHGHGSFPLLTAEHGCTGGCCTGISYYTALEYTPPAVHEDQEGFYVINGRGTARIAETEFSVEPDMSFIAPAGAVHQFKCDCGEAPLVLFWFHAQA